jgi:hypothetical protein
MMKLWWVLGVGLAVSGSAILPGCRSATRGEPAAADESAMSPEDEALRAALLDLKERDQAARGAMIELMQESEPLPGGGFRISGDQQGIMEAVGAIDAESTAFLKKMVADRGWPTISEIGEGGAGAAWLLAQHADADPEFQGRVLDLMRPLVDEGEAKGAHFALLTDRVRLARGEKQVYATQFGTDADGVMRPRPTVDWANVEARRAEVGLGTLEAYGRSMMETYGGSVELVPSDAVSADGG